TIGFLSLTLFPESRLYRDISEGLYEEATEYERIDEMICLIENLTCHTHILARAVSNPIPLTGSLPADRTLLLDSLREVKEKVSEETLRNYRDSIKSL
ncbi:MAG: radical SAM protein, partial [Prevotella sp.]|nr:radical SAM protein [Prevotella sp.]